MMKSYNIFLNLWVAVIICILCTGTILAYAVKSEQPTGTLKGTVISEKFLKPFSAKVYLISDFELNGEPLFFETKSSSKGKFTFANLPVGKYKLSVYGKAHQLDSVIITISEGKTITTEIYAKADPPYFRMSMPKRVFTPDEISRFVCEGFTEADKIDCVVYRVNLDEFLVENNMNLNAILGRLSYSDDRVKTIKLLSETSMVKEVKSFSAKINNRESEGTFAQRVNIPKLPAGVYFISAEANGMKDAQWMMITSLGMIVKTTGKESLIYTVDLSTGKKLAGVNISAFVENKNIFQGTTNENGMARISVQNNQDGWQKNIIAKYGDSLAFDETWFYSEEDENTIIHTYTDRPIYRPGDMVFFKGIIRKKTDSGYAQPIPEDVWVEVRDARDTLISKQMLRTNEFGSYFGNFELDKESATGSCSIITRLEGQTRGSYAYISVAEYRKPEFSVSVKFSKDRYSVGDRVEAKIKAEYYFGAPVANAKVDYQVLSNKYYHYESDEDYDDMYDEYYDDYSYSYGDTITQGSVKTDKNGEATISFVAKWDSSKEDEYMSYWGNDRKFSLSANVMDRANEYAYGSGNVIVTAGDFYLSVINEKYVLDKAETAKVTIKALDYDNKPIANQKIEIESGWIDYEGNTRNFNLIDKKIITTNEDGKAIYEFSSSKEAGHEIIAKALDKKGRTITSSDYVYVYSGASSEYIYTESEIQIVPDKKEYSVGDTAKILISSSNQTADMLFTIEGEKLFEHKILSLDKGSSLIEIPVKEIYGNNFFVSVCYVNEKKFFTRERKINISIKEKQFDIKIETDKKSYKPGESVVCHLKALDSDGNPVKAEMSVGVVDESIFALQEDRTPKMTSIFYAKKWNKVRTSFSFPDIYLSDVAK
ncbi:MAG: MG2 domain-containing protein, partial [Armatimonadota bacterium]